MDKVNRKNPRVVVIGAGMTGLCVAIRLLQHGITQLTLLEKGESVGGTWRENTYPGVACDVPSHAYTYSFAPNPDWSDFIAGGDEIHRYFIKVFEDHKMENYTHFGQTVISAQYEAGVWQIETDKGMSLEAELVFGATGMLHHPTVPDIPGLAEFAGHAFHSARWDHSVALQGKRIGVVGTGSSGTQLIPELIDVPGTTVTVFQRTPQWIVSLERQAYSDEQRAEFRAKPAKIAKLKRQILWFYDKGTTALTSSRLSHRFQQKLMAFNAKRFLKRSIKDPELLAKLTPDYEVGCKRVVMNSAFYDRIQQPNAQLVTAPIESMDAQGVNCKDGSYHALDVIVFATGFDPFAYMRPMNFTGRDGVSIDDAWSEKVSAYRSLMVPNFPNFFLMLGPNSPIGNYSVIAISEAQTEYALQLVRAWQSGELDSIEVSADAVKRWNEELRVKLKDTIWATGGCNSWYLDAQGSPLTWPGSWKDFLASIKTAQLDDFLRKV